MISLSLIFWIVFLLGAVYHVYKERKDIVNNWFWWAAVFLIGLQVFGSPVQ